MNDMFTVDVDTLIDQGWIYKDTDWVRLDVLRYLIEEVVGVDEATPVAVQIDPDTALSRVLMLVSPLGIKRMQTFVNEDNDTDDVYQGAV